jgi:hypothetical protein
MPRVIKEKNVNKELDFSQYNYYNIEIDGKGEDMLILYE